MDTYVWYSKSTKESGALIGQQVATAGEGTNPPRGFKGVGICFGARPAEVFKWENRNFKALFNDPRKIAAVTQEKASLLCAITDRGGMTVATHALNDRSDYADALRALGGTAFYCCSKSLTGAVLVTNQNELQEAFNMGKKTAVHENFKSKETYRVYVANGTPVVTLSKSFDTDKIIRKMATDEGNGQFSAATYNKLKGWLERGRINLDENENVLEENIVEAQNFRVQAVIDAVNNRAQMYCIEYVKVGGNYVVTNVIFAPSLEVLSEGAVALICTQINEWVATNSKTFKESLLKLINDSSETQAEEMLGAINQYVNS